MPTPPGRETTGAEPVGPTSGSDGLISRALNGTGSLITRRDPLHEPTATGMVGCGLKPSRG